MKTAKLFATSPLLAAIVAALLAACGSEDSGINVKGNQEENGAVVQTADDLPNCTEKREGIEASTKGGHDYVCEGGEWKELDTETPTYKTEDDLPNCTEKREGTEVSTKDGHDYVCEGGEWKELDTETPTYKTEDDLPNCTEKREGTEISTKDGHDYVCEDGEWKEADTAVPTYETEDDLPNCTKNREGNSSHVEETDETYVCNDGEWIEKGSSTPSEESSSSEKTTPKSSESATSSATQQTTSSGSTGPTSSASTTTVPDEPDGSCRLSTNGPLQKGGKATWTFTKATWSGDMIADLEGYKAYNAAFASTDCVWTLTGSDEKTTTVKCSETSVTATYADLGSYTASISVGGKKHDCTGTVEVEVTPVTGCKCSVDENAPDVSGGEATVTWTVSGCMTDSTAADFETWAWTGATGTTNTATATLSERGDIVTPTVRVTNSENGSMDVTCPSAKAVDPTQAEHFTCSVSPKAINLGESFTFTVSGFSGSILSASFTGEDGYNLTYGVGTTLNVTPTMEGVIKYEYAMRGLMGGQIIEETCAQYVTVTDNSSSWESKSITLSYGGAAESLELGYIYTISYSRADGYVGAGQLVCRGSGAVACGTSDPKVLTNNDQSMGSASNCTTVKVFGTATCKNTW